MKVNSETTGIKHFGKHRISLRLHKNLWQKSRFLRSHVLEVSEFTFEEDYDKDPRIPKTFTQAELEEAAEVGPVPSFFAKEGGLLSVIKRQLGGPAGFSVHPAIISAGPQAVAQEVAKQGYRYPTSYFGNPQKRSRK